LSDELACCSSWVWLPLMGGGAGYGAKGSLSYTNPLLAPPLLLLPPPMPPPAAAAAGPWAGSWCPALS
jgi:hypothetical protein